MCRLALFGNVPEFKTIARALNQLEKSYGGDGNGYYDFGIDDLDKGIQLTTAEVAYETHGLEAPVLFHTRIATVGGLSSELNHPFDAGDYVVAHNGHWREWEFYSFGERSDSQTAAALVRDEGPAVLLNSEFENSGVWVVAQKSTQLTYVIPRGSRSFVFQTLKSGGFFHASEKLRGVKVDQTVNAKSGVVYQCDALGNVEVVVLEKKGMPEMNLQAYTEIMERRARTTRYKQNSHSKWNKGTGYSSTYTSKESGTGKGSTKDPASVTPSTESGSGSTAGMTEDEIAKEWEEEYYFGKWDAEMVEDLTYYSIPPLSEWAATEEEQGLIQDSRGNVLAYTFDEDVICAYKGDLMGYINHNTGYVDWIDDNGAVYDSEPLDMRGGKLVREAKEAPKALPAPKVQSKGSEDTFLDSTPTTPFDAGDQGE